MRRIRCRTYLVAAVFALVVAGCGDDQHQHDTSPETVVDLTTVPAGLGWRDYQGVAVPVGRDGPTVLEAGSATGFAATPAGAALAAITHTVRMSLAPDQYWVRVAEREIAFGPGKDEWVTSRALLSITTRADPVQAPRVRGYTLTDYRPALAQVEIYTSYPDNSIGVNTAVVVWQHGDWLLQLPDPASTAPVVRATSTMDAAVKIEAPQ
ncbi:hypothetical protein [Nocardia sp.]|uniref:hypothetical protein n=1 Tax=Nocardia sp. TaxID=1821 RepID=UPI002589096C|nr:hypothetical protein [Nocardia sp.]